MACHSTPKTQPQSLASSVFMTPPVSAERKNASPSTTPRPPAPSRSLPSMPPPFPTPVGTPNLPPPQRNCRLKLTLREGEDVLSGLHMGGYRLLVEQVLHYLEPWDLSSCILVCNRWNHIITSFSTLQARIRDYQQEQQKDAENKHKPLPPLTLLIDRKPLGDAKNRLLQKPAVSTPTLPAPAMSLPKRVMYKHRLCPHCKAPAKQLNLRRTECTKCGFDYCLSCLKAWHEGECERQRSPKRLSSHEGSVGTKRSKKNLRRL